MNDIRILRDWAAKVMVAALWLHVPLLAAIDALVGGSIALTAGMAAAIALIATVTWSQAGSALSSRLVLGVSAMLMVSLLVYIFAGHRWQIDMHMYFFAALATLTAFCCWRTLLAAAAAVALHHLILNYALPAAVFPDGVDLPRVVVHAVIVVVETAVLMWITSRLTIAFLRADDALISARSAQTETEQMASQRDAEREQATADRLLQMNSLADKFEESVGQVAKGLGQSAGVMKERATSMSKTATAARSRSERVAAAAAETSENIRVVAAASEELRNSIREISERIGEASDMARQAVDVADSADSTVKVLSDSAERIGAVISLINDIAEQTNLLALNATIEAARAGEAGKGFAVVAQEVKALAGQTGKATDDIGGQIEAIQEVTGNAVDAIKAVVGKIRSIDEMANAIAAAIEEQSSATAEIGRSTQSAATGSQSVTEIIAEVLGDVELTADSANGVAGTAAELNTQSSTLTQEVAAFLSQIRTA